MRCGTVWYLNLLKILLSKRKINNTNDTNVANFQTGDASGGDEADCAFAVVEMHGCGGGAVEVLTAEDYLGAT